MTVPQPVAEHSVAIRQTLHPDPEPDWILGEIVLSERGECLAPAVPFETENPF